MARGKRGGYQRPSNPAAVSGPGALSARTDGKVPQMPVTGLPYGENKAVAEQQAAAPLSPQGGAGGGAAIPAGRPAAGPPAMGPDGVFSPTGRPGEPMTAGVDWGAGPGRGVRPELAEDPMLVLRVLYEKNPSPQLARILARMAARRG